MNRQGFLSLSLVFAYLHVFLSLSTATAFYESRKVFAIQPRPTNRYPRSPLPVLPNHPLGLSCWSLHSHSLVRESTSQATHFAEDLVELITDVSSFLAGLTDLFWKPIQGILHQLWETPTHLEYQSDLSSVAASIVSIPFWTQLTTTLQRVGENLFVALVFVALIQGGIAVFQYRNNPSGELVIPPGPTRGEEFPEPSSRTNSTTTVFPTVSAKATALRSGGQSKLEPTGAQSAENRTFLITNNQRHSISHLKRSSSVNPEQQSEESRLQKFLHRANRWMVVLVPWLASKISFVLQTNSHLLHIGSIMTLTSVFDIPQTFFRGMRRRRQDDSIARQQGPASKEEFSLCKGDHEHVVVIGDSLAVGLGTIDYFDKDKTSDIPFRRIENTDTSINEPGPAFPQAFAKTLAQKLQKHVSWRSAGVDGGDVQQIHTYCLGVIQEEVERGKTPDVVVILCGANDIKSFLSNPLKRSNWPRGFRPKLKHLLEAIRDLAPNATIVLPAFPTQMFHKNSPLNVFPLGLLLDSMVGFFDSQKKFVADAFPSKGVYFMGVSPREVSQWYHDDEGEREDIFDVQATVTSLLEDIEKFHEGANQYQYNTTSLIAADGVHPNARCYTKWANTLGEDLLTILE